jgi:hypothetical protein
VTGFTIPQRIEMLTDLQAEFDRIGDLELAWAAGFFDGEGSVYLNRKRAIGGTTGREYIIHSPCLSVAQVDPRPLARFALAVGGRKPGGPYQPRTAKSNAYYRWDAMGRPSVHRIGLLLWPHLSEPKREQFHRVWAALETAKGPKSPALPSLPGVAA